MLEWHNVLQENASPSDASAVSPAGLPTVESIFTRSGKLKGNAFRSAPRLRVVLAALVSISAVVFLVFFCSRVYRRRALQDFRSRRLASSDGSDAEVELCEFSDEEEEQQQHAGQRHSLSAGEERHLPLKKKLLTRATGTVSSSVEPTPQQQEQQQQDDEAVAVLFRSSPSEAYSGPEEPSPSSSPVPTSPSSVRTPTELDAAAGLLSLRSHRRASGRRASVSRRSIFVELRKLQRQMGQLQQKMYLLQRQQWQHLHLQRQMAELQQQLHLLQGQQWQQLQLPRKQRHRKQQQKHSKQQHKQREPDQERRHLFWWQQQQQEYWLQPQQQQPVLQEQMQQQMQQHSMQEREQGQLFEVQKLQQVTPYHGEEQAMHEEEQQGPQHEEREQQRHQLKRKREEQEEPDLSEEEQQQLLPPVDPLAGQLMIDEWIDPESTSREVPQPSTSQEALQPPAAPAAPGPWRSEYIRMQVMAGLPLAAPDASGATRSQASRDEDAAAFGADAAAASAASALPSAGVSSTALAPSVDVTREETPNLSSLLAHQRSEGVRPAGAGRRAPVSARRAAEAGGTKAAAGGTKAAAGRRAAAADRRAGTGGGTAAAAGGTAVTAGGTQAAAYEKPAAASGTPAEAGGTQAPAGRAPEEVGDTAAEGAGTVAEAGETAAEGAGAAVAVVGTGEAADGTGATAAGTGAAASAAAARYASPASDASQLQRSPSHAVLEHPFVRLPRLEPHVSPSSVSVDLRRALRSPPAVGHVMPLLQRAQALLSQETLFSYQLKELANTAEDMIGRLAYYEGQDLSEGFACRAVLRLGIRFLLLDAVVSTFLVLEQAPDEDDWKLVTDAISHTAPKLVPKPNLAERTYFAVSLCEELGSAIQILKTGRRPAAADLIRVKRMMFCFSWSPARFKRADFEAWTKQCDGGTDGP